MLLSSKFGVCLTQRFTWRRLLMNCGFIHYFKRRSRTPFTVDYLCGFYIHSLGLFFLYINSLDLFSRPHEKMVQTIKHDEKKISFRSTINRCIKSILQSWIWLQTFCFWSQIQVWNAHWWQSAGISQSVDLLESNVTAKLHKTNKLEDGERRILYFPMFTKHDMFYKRLTRGKATAVMWDCVNEQNNNLFSSNV